MTVPGGLQGLQIIQPLGADRAVLVAADTSSGTRRLVLVERVTRASPVPAARTELLRRGRALKALEHPKVVRVRDVFERDGDVLVISDYVEGEWLSSLMMMQPRPPISIMLRLVVDVLEGLGALHDLRDEQDRPLGFVHGAIAPDTVLVADDGVAEIARACRLPRPGSNERYVAPELRRGDAPPEPRCDIYGAGAILRDVLADAPADAKWAEPLTEIAWRACAVEPEDRWPSAAAMATTIRRIAGPRMSTAATVAEFIRKHFGASLRARRAALESSDEGTPPSSGEPISLQGSELEVVESFSSPSDVATLPPPPVKRDVAVGRVALVKKPSLVLASEDESEAKTPRPAPAPAPPPPTPTTPRAPPVRAATTTVPGGLRPPPSTGTTSPGIPQEAPTLPAAPPPPTIVPEDGDPTAAYRRKLPTFPTFEEVDIPKQRSGVLLGVLVAAAMVLTFGLGWWLGRTSTPADTATTPTVRSVATLTAPVEPTKPPPQPAPAVETATASAPTPAPSASTAPAVSASVTPVASTAPSATATAPAWMTAPRPTAVPAVTAPATPTAAPKPTATAPPTATATATTPKPTPGGYVPSEL